MSEIVYYDSLQKEGKHDIKHNWMIAHGVDLRRTRFDGKHAVPVSFGDYYRAGSNIVVDTKASVAEVAMNIGGKEHARFREECKRAQRDGYRLVILIENTEGITGIGDLRPWINAHCRACVHYRKAECDPRFDSKKCLKHGTKKPIQGERLTLAMSTMSLRYGVQFRFCTPDNAGLAICLTLGVRFNSLCSDCYRYYNGLCLPMRDGYTVGIGPGPQVDGSKRLCVEGVPF